MEEYARRRGVKLASARRVINRYLTEAGERRGLQRPSAELVSLLDRELRELEVRVVLLRFEPPPFDFETHLEELFMRNSDVDDVLVSHFVLLSSAPTPLKDDYINVKYVGEEMARSLRAIIDTIRSRAGRRVVSDEEEGDEMRDGVLEYEIRNMPRPRADEAGRVVAPGPRNWFVRIFFWYRAS
ncbi:MAG: hypothetical protein V2G41_09965 [bacterium JZ-2024 1]